jgi:hypothetical protein
MIELHNKKSLARNLELQINFVYIGRPSPLGNPFTIGRDGTRDEVIAKYRIWLDERLKQPTYQTMLNNMKKLHKDYGTLGLVCWCSPLACHGDVIKEKLEEE